jgi:hypothetical protein
LQNLQNLQAWEEAAASRRTTTLRRSKGALESAGIEFIDGDEPGVKLRKAKGKRK